MNLNPFRYFKEKAQSRIVLHLRATKTEIHPKPAVGMFNDKCFMNVVQFQSNSKGAISECIFVNDGSPTLHYINVDTEGNHLETTLGVFCKNNEYYEIRTVDPEEYLNIINTFDRGLKYWKEAYTNWFERLFIDRVV